ncbi:hypothetical protein J8L73_09970 [Pseudoalteromonas sp. MMG006]|uniref:hypothetical protein n=1 Tax=Pseudoalteromonas sp. MMG006 TaxID=2822683 RepID=UPI001B36E460|nr:hypothetical protein [Pseudoalteromonas sp. MMG006]MBQ4799449.1 hypothetical protein [Pseudoalteromonas sp. MMG006]
MRAFKTGILIASALLFIGAISFAPSSEQDLSLVNNCQHQTVSTNSQSVIACAKVEEDSSWFSWLTGDSRSAQFHYLDLLELLTSSEDSKNPPSLKPLF